MGRSCRFKFLEVDMYWALSCKSGEYASLSIHVNSSFQHHIWLESSWVDLPWKDNRVLNTSNRRQLEEHRHFRNFYSLLSFPFSKDNKKHLKICIKAREEFSCLSCFVKWKRMRSCLYSYICLDYSREYSLLSHFFFIIRKCFVYLKLISLFLHRL